MFGSDMIKHYKALHLVLHSCSAYVAGNNKYATGHLNPHDKNEEG